MKRLHRGHLVVAVMAVVFAWSVLAFAQRHQRPAAPPGQGAHGGLHPGRPAPPAARPPGAPLLAHEGAEAVGGEEHERPAPLNWTEFGTKTPPFIAMLINFGILAAGYYLLGRKPIAAALQSRRDTIAKDIDEAEARAATYQAKLARLEEEVQQAREALVRAGEAERDRIVTEAEAKAERMRKDAEFLVEQEMKQIRQDLWRDTVEVAVTAAEDLLKKRVTAADQERIAEDYLADLGGRRSIPAPAPGPQENAT